MWRWPACLRPVSIEWPGRAAGGDVAVCRFPPGRKVFCLSVRRGCTAGWRDRELGRFDAYIYSMGKLHFDRTDYSIVVKNRAPLPNSWRWEIYRAGRSSPIEQSSVYFHSVATANRAGKEALRQLLDKLKV